jgi:hypothetical protein
MHDEQPRAKADSRVDVDIEANRTTLELCFVAVVSLIVIAAFISALSYEFVSARTPIVIMVPLIILIGVQFVRAVKASRTVDVSSVLSAVAKGNSKKFNRAAGFVGWMLLLLALIIVAGHYAGIAILMFILLRLVSKEDMLFSLALSAGVTIVIFLLFELGFDIELHRGAIFRIWAGDAGLWWGAE